MRELGIESRFWIQRELGRGANSLVVDVWDALHDVRRALKIATNKASRRAFEAEYRLLTEVRHAHVVRAYDFGISTTGLPYYTLELIDGSAFDGTAPPEVLAVLASQVLEALATLHLRGIVHRDLKPRNILVAGEGIAAVARLIDFGLATRTPGTGDTGGTLPYMAPEAARGEVVDGRADLYALGVMLYEGLVPDAMKDNLERIAKRHIEAPVAPDDLNPTIPKPFADFVMRLIEPEPAKRFANAFEAIDALVRCSGPRLSISDEQTMVERMMRGGSVCHRPRELERLLALAREARGQRRPRAGVIVGREGIGKTPLMRELGVRLCLEGFRVAHFRTSKASDAPLDRILRAAHALRADVVAEVTAEWTSSRDSVASFADRDPVTFVARLSALLVDAFADEPTALLIDDVHRAEMIALQVVRHMASDAMQAPLLIVCASDVEGSRPLGEGIESIDLAPLDGAATSALVAHRIQALSLPQPALDRLLADGRGEPALTERTLARFLVDGLVIRRQGKYVFAGGRYRRRADPREAWQSRIAALRDERGRTAFAAAVLRKGIDATRVAALTGDDVATVNTALASLAREGFLAPAQATTSPSYIFPRRVVRQALYDAAPADTLQIYHDRAAALFDSIDTEPSVELVEHVLRGSDNERAVAVAAAAGDRAARVFSDVRAIEYFTLAYERLDATQAALGASIASRLGRSFERTGELERAMTWYRAALGETRGCDVVTSVEASLGLAGALLASGQPQEASRHAAVVLSLVDDRMPHFTAAALRIQGSVAIARGDHQVASDRLAMAASILEESLMPLSRSAPEIMRACMALSIEVLLERARLSRRTGDLANTVRYAKRALQRARAIGDPSAVAAASAVLARGFARAGRLDAARRALFSGLRGVRNSGDRLREASILRELGHVRLREANLDAALDRYANSLDIVRSLGARAHESACLSDIGFVRTMLGDFRAAQVSLVLAVEAADASADIRAQMAALTQLAHTMAWIGDLAGASSILENVLGSPHVKADATVSGVAGAIKASLDARLGKGELAARFLDKLGALLARIEDPAEEAIVLFFTCYAALELGRLDDALTLANVLRTVVSNGTLAYLEAPATLLMGNILRQRGETTLADESLKHAAAVAARQRMRPIEIQARLALGQLHAGTDVAAEQLTRGMEGLQVVVRDLPEEMTLVVLNSHTAIQLREAFGHERARVLGR